MTDSLLLDDRDGSVAIVTFNDPERLNAMTEAMGGAIAERVAALSHDEDVRAVVLTGAGRAFSAGGDLEMIERMAREGAADPAGPTRARNREFMRSFYGLYLAVRELPQPTVAAINGHAIGAGCCVALACDTRIAARDARMGLNFTQIGIHPGMAATWTLPRIVGPAHAAELLYTGRLLEGDEAERIGLVNRTVERDQVLIEACALAQAMAQCAPLAVRGTKRSLLRSEHSTLEAQLDREAHEQSLCYETADLLDGVSRARRPRQERR